MWLIGHSQVSPCFGWHAAVCIGQIFDTGYGAASSKLWLGSTNMWAGWPDFEVGLTKSSLGSAAFGQGSTKLRVPSAAAKVGRTKLERFGLRLRSVFDQI